MSEALRPDEERPRLERGEEPLGVLPRLQELMPQQVRPLVGVAQQQVLCRWDSSQSNYLLRLFWRCYSMLTHWHNSYSTCSAVTEKQKLLLLYSINATYRRTQMVFEEGVVSVYCGTS